MIRIAVLTATRAEYGLLSPVIKRMQNDSDIDLRVVVTGAHLSPEFGCTYKEIEADNIQIDEKIGILENGDGAVAISKTMANALAKFGEYFDRRRPDTLLVLGDRYETLAVCIAATNAQIPIIHMHGGETTQGAIDEAVRHSITKMSYLHFTSTEEYRHRIIQLGENPNRVFTVGATGVENALKIPLMSREELEASLDFKLNTPYIVATYHPVTLDKMGIDEQISEFLSALDEKPEYTYIITKANADAGGRRINELLETYAKEHSNVHVVASLGVKRYLSALKYCYMVMGNSSSGLIEVPSFHVPTVNIGDRQKGRTHAQTVIDCNPDKDSILRAMETAESDEFRRCCEEAVNPYEKADVAKNIVDIVKREMLDKTIDLKKEFYDIQFQEV